MATIPFNVKALYEYASSVDDDLNFPADQIMKVTEEEDADWYYGEYEDSVGKKQEGLFPKNFVKVLEPATPPRPSRQLRSPTASDTTVSADGGADAANAAGYRGSTSEAVKTDPIKVAENSENQQNRQWQEPQSQSQSTALHSVPESPLPHGAAKSLSKPDVTPTSRPDSALVPEKSAPGSFRDRINAFNKPTASPVAPMKPSGLGSAGISGFIKKPFVAPPPRKNVHAPLSQESHRQTSDYRADHVGSVDQASQDVEAARQEKTITAASLEDEAEDAPKPTSLKERIALLQKQQMEQSARHVEAGQKEKPKKPLKRQTQSEAPLIEQNQATEGVGEQIFRSETEGNQPQEPISTGDRLSQEEISAGTPTISTIQRSTSSDARHDNYLSTGQIEESEEGSTGRGPPDDTSRVETLDPISRSAHMHLQAAHVTREADPVKGNESEDEDNQDGEDDENDGDIDPEVKRRMDLRERMAKMSGGMGMAGMFGGIPARGPGKHSTSSLERDPPGSFVSGAGVSPTARAPPIPVMPVPASQTGQISEPAESSPSIGQGEMRTPTTMVQGQKIHKMPDVEDSRADSLRSTSTTTERPSSYETSEALNAPIQPSDGLRRAPPPLPKERPVPLPPIVSRPVPPLHSSDSVSPSEKSGPEDETSSNAKDQSLHGVSEIDHVHPLSPDRSSDDSATRPLPTLPHQSQLRSESSEIPTEIPASSTQEHSPHLPVENSKRASRLPFKPGADPVLPSAPQSKAWPPPPPPSDPAPSKASNGGRDLSSGSRKSIGMEVDEEVMAYDDGSDTEIAAGAAHEDALQSRVRSSSLNGESLTEEAALRHSGLPSLGPSQLPAPRAVPPPPPDQPPRHTKRSSDMPRTAPPPLPSPLNRADDRQIDDYDPYHYNRPPPRVIPTTRGNSYGVPSKPDLEQVETSVPDSPPSEPQTANIVSPPSLSGLGSAGARQSTEVQRTSTGGRRSTEVPRSSSERGFMATDIDLGHESLWWIEGSAIPPVIQDRRDILVETEETSTTRRGGTQAITRDIYVLFMDYSQTVITAHFEARHPASATVEQRHEPPPRALRQDQLEESHLRLGSPIADMVSSKKDTIIGDGTPHTLPLEVISSLPDALKPVGVRAYGAVVYANLANASVQQHDEIRSGDIVTFRNAKFQGHRGPMHAKYSAEVGKPDHVGIVIDWDGTKKKVRAWEQGRESKKIKSESFKFGDLRSGEVKVWRVMPRSWVGWEGQN